MANEGPFSLEYQLTPAYPTPRLPPGLFRTAITGASSPQHKRRPYTPSQHSTPSADPAVASSSQTGVACGGQVSEALCVPASAHPGIPHCPTSRTPHTDRAVNPVSRGIRAVERRYHTEYLSDDDARNIHSRRAQTTRP
ncbi:uncharacterized protein H6S33_006977 [Morchella sextelata]|uniref:uncharacterized protein n=1 Tax=Morchella sextelata TaxID=1174677 RepID=UPI001D041E78|nr:uncharacterized protein H6S33_006977 [Morchella sextelata]KAH0603946.1 hypothetical protein H6S33_006977 [Morchella sextelata]